MRTTRRKLLGLLGLGAAAAALGASKPAAASESEAISLAKATNQAIAGADAMTAATGERWVTIPLNMLERERLLGEMRGRAKALSAAPSIMSAATTGDLTVTGRVAIDDPITGERIIQRVTDA